MYFYQWTVFYYTLLLLRVASRLEIFTFIHRVFLGSSHIDTTGNTVLLYLFFNLDVVVVLVDIYSTLVCLLAIRI